MKWKYFAGAVILGGGLAIKFGAPIFAVAAGAALAAVLTWRTQAGAGSGARKKPPAP